MLQPSELKMIINLIKCITLSCNRWTILWVFDHSNTRDLLRNWFLEIHLLNHIFWKSFDFPFSPSWKILFKWGGKILQKMFWLKVRLILEQLFSTFLILWPFKVVSQVVVSPIKVFSLLFHNCNVATIMNLNVISVFLMVLGDSCWRVCIDSPRGSQQTDWEPLFSTIKLE